MLNSFNPSGQKSPCPICGRTKDGDCRILSDGRVFCHTAKNGIKGKKCESNEIYIYLGKSDEAQGAGMWKLDDAMTAKAPRQYGIRYFDYFFWDGAAVPAQRYRKDVEGQPKEVKWAKGGLAGRSQNEVAPYLWEKAAGARQLFVVRGELKAELLAGKGFTAISCLNQKDERLAAELRKMRADGVEIVLVPDCDEADLDKWFRYLSNEVPGVMQLLAPGLPWPKPPADGGLGIEDWIYAKSPSNEQILAAISSMGDSGLSSNEKNLVTLEEKIQTIVDKHEDPLTRSALVKKEASELGFSLAAAEVNSFIRQAGYKEPVLYGEDVDMPDDSEAELWGNLLLYGSSNLVVAAPKVGKTSLITHIMGCIMSRKSHCLDQPIHNLCDHFIILGSDMARKQWKKLILKEGLGTKKPNGKINMPNIKLATKGTKLDLSREGLKYIVGLCVARPNAMLVVDCLRTYSDGDENTRDFIAPIDRLMVALAEADCKTTVICIHHARKSGGATAIEAASGHSSITSAFDQTLNMNWLNPADTEILQRDKRIVVTSSGRGEDQSIVVEQVGPTAKWVNHGNAEDLIKAEAIIKAEEALTSQQVKVYDQGQTIYENTGKGLKARAVMELLQCSRQAARRYLATLHRKGLFIRTGQKGAEGYTYYPHWAERTEEGSASSLPSADLGGRSDLKGAIDPPSNPQDLDQFSSPKKGSITLSQKEQPCLPLETEFSTGLCGSSDPLVSLNGNQRKPMEQAKTRLRSIGITEWKHKETGLNSLSSSSSLKEPIPMPFMAGLTSNERALYANNSANDTETLKPQLEQAVQVFRKGEWESGWTICDSRNPHSLRIRTERDGKVFQLANQRWDIDLRPEPLEVPASPSKEGVGAAGLNTSSEDLQRASNRVEIPATDAERDSFF